MKKSLVAVAILAASASAFAANVSVYGVIDMGFSVSKKSGADGDSRWNAQMKSGMRNSLRFGLKGVEELGSGKAKLGGGFLKASSADGTEAASDSDVVRYGVSADYDYVLSKRTHLYANYGFAQQNYEKSSDDTTTRNRGMEFTMGMVHYF